MAATKPVIVREGVLSRRLECKLDSEEIGEKVLELSRTVRDQVDSSNSLENAKERAKKCADELKEIDGAIRVLSVAITTERETRSVECDELLNFADSRVFVRRQDTDSLVSVRNMRDDELHMNQIIPGMEDDEQSITEDELRQMVLEFFSRHPEEAPKDEVEDG